MKNFVICMTGSGEEGMEKKKQDVEILPKFFLKSLLNTEPLCEEFLRTHSVNSAP